MREKKAASLPRFGSSHFPPSISHHQQGWRMLDLHLHRKTGDKVSLTESRADLVFELNSAFFLSRSHGRPVSVSLLAKLAAER
jgi:hypothetical protein